jgi:hypothetical protein
VSITTIIIGAGLMVQAFNAAHMIPAALIVFGGSLILGGAIAARGFWRQPRPPSGHRWMSAIPGRKRYRVWKYWLDLPPPSSVF